MKQLKIKYKGNTLSPYNIEKVLIKKETEDYVTLKNDRRESKRCEYHGYFDSWSEAHEWMLEQAKKNFIVAKSRLTFRKNIFDKINSMVKP